MKTFAIFLSMFLLTETLATEVSFSTAMQNLEILESYAKSFYSSYYGSASITTILSCFIRESKYNDDIWRNTFGACPSGFRSYVIEMDEKSNTEAAYVINYSFIKVRANEKIDFQRFFAAINALSVADSFTRYDSAFGGWAGDLVELFYDVKDANSSSLDEIYNEASNYLGKKGGFTASVLLADLDAPIIYSFKRNSAKSLATIMTEYYENEDLSHSSRIRDFVNLVFPRVTEITKNDLRNAVYKAYSTNSCVNEKECLLGFREKGSSCSFYQELIVDYTNFPIAVCNVFADYLYNNTIINN